MKRRKLVSALLVATMVSNLLFSSPLTKVVADTNGGGTAPAKLNVTKTVEWDPNDPNEAKIVITSDVPDLGETQVLFLGSLCTNHSMDSTSSGGLATIGNPDLLIVDETLAVGDMRFQEKCLERIKELLNHGTSLLFVSHSIDQVREVCKRSI